MFGMVGIGGSAAYADTAARVSVGVPKSRFNPTEMNVVEQVMELVTKEFG